jgi:hypothetical protein
MKKLLLMVVVLAGCLALVGTVFAAGPVCKPPVCKPPVMKPAKLPPTITVPEIVEKKVTAEAVLCKGATKGKTKLCGPCAPTIKWAVSWKTAELGPTKTGKYMIVKKGKLMKEPKPAKEPALCW